MDWNMDLTVLTLSLETAQKASRESDCRSSAKDLIWELFCLAPGHNVASSSLPVWDLFLLKWLC